MQEENENKKKILQKAIGKVVQTLRNKMSKGINIFYYEYDISNYIISSTENGNNDARISTIWKFANAFGYTCSDFIKLVEKELPENFNFYDD